MSLFSDYTGLWRDVMHFNETVVGGASPFTLTSKRNLIVVAEGGAALIQARGRFHVTITPTGEVTAFRFEPEEPVCR